MLELERKSLSKYTFCSHVQIKSNPHAEVAEPLLTSTITQARNGNLPIFLRLLCLTPGRMRGTQDRSCCAGATQQAALMPHFPSQTSLPTKEEPNSQIPLKALALC